MRVPFVVGCLIAWLGSACAVDAGEADTRAPNPRVEVEPAPEPELSARVELEAAPEPVPLVEVEVEPPPEPAPFAGRETVRVDELLAALEAEVETLAAGSALREDYARFLARFELEARSEDEQLYLDYVRVKLAFEATRAGGSWGLAWDITNEQPRSDEVWAHWQSLELGPAPAGVDELPPLPEVTAIAECDELSALFAFVAQRIGLSKASDVGLFWPTGNHTVAVWTIDPKGERPVRVVVPTSQIFLEPGESLGTAGFDPWTQKNIFDYRRQDAAASLELPGALASRFVLAVREQGGQSQAQLQAARNARERRQWVEAEPAELGPS